MPAFFLKYGISTKRVNESELPTDLTAFKQSCIDKLQMPNQDVSELVLLVKDKDYGIECELDDVSQLYDGALLTVRQDDPIPENESDDADLPPAPSPPSTKRRLEDDDDDDRATKYRRLDAPGSSEFDAKQMSDQESNTVGSESDHGVREKYTAPRNAHTARLNGVPYNSKNGDVRDFFDRLSIAQNGIFFARNPRGDCTGEVFVSFSTEDDLEQGLKRHNEYMGRRYIEVDRADPDDFQEKIKIGNGIAMVPIARGTHILKMKGFSYNANEKVVRKFLQEHQPVEVHILYDHRNRNSGVVFCEFGTREECLSAFELNKTYLGRRYIKMFHSSVDELRLGIAEMIGEPLPTDLDTYVTCLRLEGLPHQAAKDEITNFFRSVDVVPTRIHSKRTGGTAYIEFATPDDLRLAISRNGFSIGSHRVALYQALPHELRSVGIMASDSAREGDRTDRDRGRERERPIRDFSHTRSPDRSWSRGRRESETLRRNNTNTDSRRDRDDGRDRFRRDSEDGYNRRDRGNSYGNRRRRSRSYSRSRSRSGSRSGEATPPVLLHVEEGSDFPVSFGHAPPQMSLPRAQQQQRGMHGLSYTTGLSLSDPTGVVGHVGGLSHTSLAPFSHFGQSGVGFDYSLGVARGTQPLIKPSHSNGASGNSCSTNGQLVRIRGLPFESRPEEIVDFFKGYRIDPKTLDMPRDSNGRPSGQATIVFDTTEEAYRAVDQLDRKYLGRRYVLLDVVKRDWKQSFRNDIRR